MAARCVGVDELRGELSGVRPGELVGVVSAAGVGLGVAVPERSWAVASADADEAAAAIGGTARPRWTWWDTASGMVGPEPVPTCWDVGAVHQLIFGGARPIPALAWAAARGLPTDRLPTTGQLDLLGAVEDDGGDVDDAVRPDGQLRPEWAGGGWCRDPQRLAAWAAAALATAERQRALLAGIDAGGDPLRTAWSESAAELVCAELHAGGLPVDSARAEQIIAAAVGPRPRNDAEAAAARAARDDAVLRHARDPRVDLRNPAQVKAMLAAIGVDVPDTRSWRLEPLRVTHPLIGALLDWRKAERIATTYGYAWLDRHVRGGRLRGAWTGSDGAAGRMTAQAGLHNLPAELRPAVAAEPGHVLVRADLGQIEPRVLAVVSGDPGLAGAGREDDLYAPVAARLRVQRPVAKVAVLAAMYGQTSGTAGQALRGLRTAYPVAMSYLDAAYEDGRSGRDLRTHGGRLIRMPALPQGLDEAGIRAAQGARGRYARNALIQGAAAEFFKTWAVTVRARAAALGAQIVLCLHDELLLHVARERAEDAAELLRTCLDETARRWQDGRTAVRFVADVSIVQRWSDAK